MKSNVLVIPVAKKKTTFELYREMKEAIPYDMISSTAKRLNPELTDQDIAHRCDALVQWLATIPLALAEGRWFQMIETVDVLWHAFILHTKDYAEFCDRFYGGFLHHSPPMDYSEDRTEYACYTLAMIRREFGGNMNAELENLSADVKCCFRYVIE